MSESDYGAGEEIAQWLKEAGRRSGRALRDSGGAPEDDSYNSPASLHRYLEELAGKPLQSHADVLTYLGAVAGNLPRTHHEYGRRKSVRELTLLSLLVLSYIQYYYWDVRLQISALNSVQVFVPVRASLEKKT